MCQTLLYKIQKYSTYEHKIIILPDSHEECFFAHPFQCTNYIFSYKNPINPLNTSIYYILFYESKIPFFHQLMHALVQVESFFKCFTTRILFPWKKFISFTKCKFIFHSQFFFICLWNFSQFWSLKNQKFIQKKFQVAKVAYLVKMRRYLSAPSNLF